MIVFKFLKNFALIGIILSIFFGILMGLMQTATYIAVHYDSMFAGLIVLLLPIAIIFAIGITAAEGKETND